MSSALVTSSRGGQFKPSFEGFCTQYERPLASSALAVATLATLYWTYDLISSENQVMAERNIQKIEPSEEDILWTPLSRGKISSDGLEFLTDDQINFLEFRAEELEELSTQETASTNWRELGKGCFKKVWVHSDFPEIVIKTPRQRLWNYFFYDPFISYFKNYQSVELASHSFSQIKLPHTHLFMTPNGHPILVEERIKLANYTELGAVKGKDEAVRQFVEFRKETNLCDVSIGHNVAPVEGSEPLEIAVFDYDRLLGPDQTCYSPVFVTGSDTCSYYINSPQVSDIPIFMVVSAISFSTLNMCFNCGKNTLSKPVEIFVLSSMFLGMVGLYIQSFLG